MMATFSEADRKRIKELLAGMENPVRLVHFTQTLQCELCRQTQGLLEDLVPLSDKLSLEVYNFLLDKEKVAQYRIDKVPATIVVGAKDHGVRLYGLPGGYEFVVLVDTIRRVSQGNSGLEPESVDKLKDLKSALHIEVFVTPTCPYCPGAARLAHQLAIENEFISADIIEATEFPELVGRYRVRGVPRTVVNGALGIEGSLPEADFVDQILAAAGLPKETALASR
jgi:glutaredoxin-like protein